MDRRRRRHHALGLIVHAVCGAHLEGEFLRQTFCDIFDGTADGVAAIECALRTTQHFDPLDIINVQNCPLRAVEIDIVEVDTDAGFKAGNRILLAHAADERGQRRIGATRVFERDIGCGVADVSDVERALRLERGARIGGNGDGNILKAFLAAARSDNDFTLFAFIDHCLILGKGGHRKGCNASQCDPGQQNAARKCLEFHDILSSIPAKLRTDRYFLLAV